MKRTAKSDMKLVLAATAPARLRGLLRTEPHDRTLLIVPCCDVHTFGMRHRVDVAFVDRRGRVIGAHRGVGPGRRLRARRAVGVLERFSTDESPWFQVGDAVTVGRGESDDKTEGRKAL